MLTAVTAVFTYLVRIPIAPTRGYLNLGDVAVYFSAFTLGPFTALLSGGLGTALADLLAGYPQWIPISMLVHGLQGLLAALVAVIPLKAGGRWPLPPALARRGRGRDPGHVRRLLRRRSGDVRRRRRAGRAAGEPAAERGQAWRRASP